jgi:glycosyltransferase involved in cell wall biosynthesis
MKIGVDLCDLDPAYTGGINSFAFGLLSGLLAVRRPGDQLVLLVTGRNEAFLREKFAGSDVGFLKLPLGGLARHMDRLLILASWAAGNFKFRYWYDRIFRARMMRDVDQAVDVLAVPLGVLRFYGMRAPTLLSIHDIQQEYHPELFSLRDRIRRWAPYRLSAWRAAMVQASSHYIEDCLIEKFSFMTAQKIAVIPEGVDRQAFSLDAPGEMPSQLADLRGEDFVFYPAQIWPHKNHILLVDALAHIRDQTGVELPCVLTGHDYGHWAAVQGRIAALGLKQVRYLGRVSFPQLLWLYRNCRAVLALGMHESSSLPVREGAVFGKVLIALDIPPNREVQDHLKVTLVGGANGGDLAVALIALRQNLGQIVNDGAQNATLIRHFDWKAIAGEYYRVLSQMVQAEPKCPS